MSINTSQASAQSEVSRTQRKETYADLIYKALLGQGAHQMTLKDLYQWFIDNTEKPKERQRGWKNSVRSNLSLNQAFQRLEGKTSRWSLATCSAEGIRPTHQYRNCQRSRVFTKPTKKYRMVLLPRPLIPRTRKARRKVLRRPPSHVGPQFSDSPWLYPCHEHSVPQYIQDFKLQGSMDTIQASYSMMWNVAWPFGNTEPESVWVDLKTHLPWCCRLPDTLGLW
ncbi:hypothetical protein BDP55DRAFT_625043 [Colletotrichum godetiae]|uniref:Fork-head domain-containing protein n=1 Tax=Colletotrichum godetiae TaxID=1209918 RepID=A0AAJ0A4V3_9PEZI|nr:uncharacterized protein BDP55DRAFT_625043 [Colletotrichum godetiae]KAK1656544.1 hypothetical protein BDP55DRAFT_625043 [Colletotrichum godetiae]